MNEFCQSRAEKTDMVSGQVRSGKKYANEFSSGSADILLMRMRD